MKQLLIALCLLLLGCYSKNDESNFSSVEGDELIQVSLSTNGRKPDSTSAFAIELNNDLSVNYYGGSQSELAGNYVGKIGIDDWQKIITLINGKHIKDTFLTENSFEDNSFDLSILFRDKKHYISGFYSNAPQNIKELCELILSTKKKTNLIRVTENHLFEVKVYKVKQQPEDSIDFVVPKVN